MAKGRMLNRSVSLSAKFQALPDDTCRLLATWIIPQLDCNGVFYADPVVVRSLVFPRRSDVGIEQVAGYLQAIEKAGLIFIFNANGSAWQCWPGFADNQQGLRPDREGTSTFPKPVRNNSGVTPEQCQTLNENKVPEVEVEVEVKVEEREIGADAPNPPDSKPSAKSKADPRTSAPAIQAIREITSKYPPHELYGQVISVLGECPDKDKLRVCRDAWLARGYNPNALTWALEWYPKGPPVQQKQVPKNTRRRTQVDEPSEAEIEAARAKARKYIAEHEGQMGAAL